MRCRPTGARARRSCEPGANTDRVVTEHGAELQGQSIRERTKRLIAIAHPKFRDELTASAREFGYL
ncbi:MAG: 4-hydroxybutyrate CoA-transferase [Solirubrobacterales bacterium]|nr:4-hydroxybutyrate CoA-transferase [Solirubrobacterales bacterium]